MSMDRFWEEVAVKQKNAVNRILYLFSWVLIVFSGLIAVMSFSSLTSVFSMGGGIDWPTLLIMLISGGIAVYTYFMHDKILTEYEYTFTNGALDFAEVYNNKKRKSLGSLNVKNVDSFGKVNSDKFRRYVNMPGIKRMNWFLNREAELYYFYFTKESDKKMIIFEPSDDLVAYIKEYLPHGAFQE